MKPCQFRLFRPPPLPLLMPPLGMCVRCLFLDISVHIMFFRLYIISIYHIKMYLCLPPPCINMYSSFFSRHCFSCISPYLLFLLLLVLPYYYKTVPVLILTEKSTCVFGFLLLYFFTTHIYTQNTHSKTHFQNTMHITTTPHIHTSHTNTRAYNSGYSNTTATSISLPNSGASTPVIPTSAHNAGVCLE